MTTIAAQYITVPVPLVTTAETTIATTDSVPIDFGITGEGVRVAGVLNVTTGTAATAITVRVRSGVGTGGTLIGVAATHTLPPASSPANIAYEVLDTGSVASVLNVQYTVTVQQTAATANGQAFGTIYLEPASRVPG